MAGVAVAVAVLALIGAMSYRVMIDADESARWVRHTHEVQFDIGSLEGRHASMSRHWRTHLIEGSLQAALDFEADARAVSALIDRLRDETQDNPGQQQRIARAKALLDSDIAFMERAVRQRREGALAGPEATLARIAEASPAVASFVALGNEMRQEEKALLEQRERRSEEFARRARLAIVAGDTAALLLLGAAFFVVFRENRDRYAAQRDAQAHSEAVEDLYENAPCGYHSVDGGGLIVKMNATELGWLGYAREEVVGRMRHPELMTPESAKYFEESAFPLFMKQGWLKDVEFDYVRKDGSVMSAALSATSVCDRDGRFLASRSTLFDITERKQARDKIRALNARLAERARELEGANKELGSFSYSVSHDLRSPLRAIDGFALMLEEDYASRLDDEGRRLLSVVRENATRMANLIDDLLAFSRLGRKPLEKASVDMDALVRAVIGRAPEGPRAGAFDIAVLPAAEGDRALLQQVWANLIANAVKYSGGNPAQRIEIGGRRSEGETVYWVRDNGVGFDMRYYSKLFGVFQRLHSQDEFPGTGVGLAIVQRVVLRHGGRVWAESTPGSGACFHFSLPATGDA